MQHQLIGTCSRPSSPWAGKLIKVKLLGALLMTLALSPTTSAQSLTPSKLAFHGKLDNGLEIVVVPDRRAPVVTHMVWYKVGGADEPPGKSGIAHFLEHLMFKGTDKIPAGEFSKIVARLGGQDNAFTAQDITAYFQRVAKEKLPDIMSMEADRMANLRLDEKEVLTERKVIREERRSRVDNDPSSLLQEQIMAALYIAHPYHTPVIGWDTEIRELTREDALRHYKKFYAPNNAILVVTGDVEPDQVMALAKNTYGKIPANPEVGMPRVRPAEPEPITERRVILRDGRVGKANSSATILRRVSTPPRDARPRRFSFWRASSAAATPAGCTTRWFATRGRLRAPVAGMAASRSTGTLWALRGRCGRRQA